MKKFLNILGSVAIVATVLSGCVKNDETTIDNPVSKKRIITVTADAAEESRTVLDEANMRVLWDAYDHQDMQLIEVGYKADGSSIEHRVYASDSHSDDNGETATFTFAFEDGDDWGADCVSFRYRAIMIYDDDELVPGDMREYYIKNTQDPTPETFDPRADVLIAQARDFNERQESFSFKFTRVVALTKMTLKNLPAGSKIRSVSFITDEDNGTPIVGQVIPDYDAAGNCILEFVGKTDDYDNHRVTMSYLNREFNDSFDVYFMIAPVTLQSGKELTIRVVTTDKYYEKVITLDRELKFRTDKINKLSVNMKGTEYETEADTLMMVTDASELQVGDKIIIAYIAAKKALGTSATTSYREAADIEIDESNIALHNPNVQIITLENGSAESTFAFNVGNGYLCCPGNKKLTTSNRVDASTSWKITIDEKGNANIINQKEVTDYLQYNYNSPRFCCYQATQKSVQIFHYVSTLPVVQPIEPQYVSFAAGNYKINYKVKGEDDFKVVEVSGCVKSAYIATRGTITINVDRNSSKEKIEGSVIIASKAHPDVTAKVQIIQNAVGQENTASIVFGDLGYTNAQVITTVEAIKDIVVLTFAKKDGSNAPTYYDSGSTMRVYHNNTITFTPADGITITKIAMQFSAEKAMGGAQSTFDTGTYSLDYNNYIGTWTGSTTSPIIYKNTQIVETGPAARITKIEVTYY